MSWHGPNPSQSPNPLYGPAREQGRRDGGSNLRDSIWFIVGMILTAMAVCALGFWIASSPVEEEDDGSIGLNLVAGSSLVALTPGPSPNAWRGEYVGADSPVDPDRPADTNPMTKLPRYPVSLLL